MRRALDRLREVALVPRPAAPTPGDVIRCRGVGDGRIVARVKGLVAVEFDRGGRSSANVRDLEWVAGAWVVDPGNLGAAGEVPGEFRFQAGMGRGTG